MHAQYVHINSSGVMVHYVQLPITCFLPTFNEDLVYHHRYHVAGMLTTRTISSSIDILNTERPQTYSIGYIPKWHSNPVCNFNWCRDRGGTTGSKGQLISFFAADFRNDFQAFSWRFLNSATSI